VFILLDANVTAGYYLPRSLKHARAVERIENLLDSIRAGDAQHFLYIPNFCIAEVFGVFMKYAFGRWNRDVKGKTLDKRVYQRLVEQFQSDIHNGKFIYQYELSRYHILGTNLIAPVDHHYQYRRTPTGTKKTRNHRPMGTMDHLIVAMAVQLGRIHGVQNVAIVSSDHRLCDMVMKCHKGKVKPGTAARLKLSIAEAATGLQFAPKLFPRALNLAKKGDAHLREAFGTWPLPVTSSRLPSVYRHRNSALISSP
jgi:hypothetical protein